MRSLSMRTSLLATAAVALVVALVVGVVSVARMSAIADRAESVYDNALRPLSVVQDIEQLIWHSRWASLSNLTGTDPVKVKAYAEETSAMLDQVSVRIEEYDRLTVTDAERAAMATFADHWAVYLDLRKESAALKQAGKVEEWQAFRSSTLNPSIVTAMEDLTALKELSQGHATATAAAARQTADQARNVIIIVLVAGVVLAAAFSLLVARGLVRRLSGLESVLAAMAAGDLTERPADTADDEIGRMSRAVHQANAHMRAAVRTLAEASAGLGERSTELQRASATLSSNTDEASGRVSSIDAAAGEVTAGVSAVASGAEEMGAAIREIAVSATEAAQVAADAVRVASQAEELMTKLDSSSAEIDNVVKVITAIAAQTNLLALNATIEAARAGESGKGFAVVAGEVKDLAQETGKATEEISRRIEAIQADTRTAVESISGIGQIIGRINDYQNTIASAVEEQSATTNGMTSDLNRAAGGTSQISSQIGEVVQVTAATREAAHATETAAGDLARISGELRTAVAGFSY
ncbi:methyl-accepting chemotaxis protein [Catenuloplanes nepalensis]|uniref:Methyl-accepting chemotaxis protein n=1 Tax=Catenuloplanes nepalensis TaxID=587533 RepID=A0ABT9MV52_9ACTN|nr:methyl-accepting chemotaxis protein [Catenuloplanes nepalensis]MDP9795323.1 methyl-accepting chemotaxis protein [Catenuloplanes nepalensis]